MPPEAVDHHNYEAVTVWQPKPILSAVRQAEMRANGW